MMRCSKVIISTMIMSMGMGVVCYGATPNAIREFIGMSTIDSNYTTEEREQIKLDYGLIERHNRLAQLLIDSNGDRSVLDEEIDKEIGVVKEEIEVATESLYEAFNKESVSVVKEKSANLSNLETKLADIRKKGEEIPAELKENPYVDAYKEVMRIEDLLSKEKDIGTVGNALKSPLEVKFDIVEPYGRYTTKDGSVVESSGVKIRGLETNNVMSLWAGTVKSITPVNGLYEIVVEHSSYMHSKYINVKDVKVEVGEEVNQYTYLGKLGKLEGSEYPYLQLEILMDNATVNPMYFFGTRGINALKEYTSKSGSKINMKDYLNVKDSINEEEVSDKPIYNKTGDVEDGAVVPSLNGNAPNPSNTILESEIEDDITSRIENKGNSIKTEDKE